MDPSAQRSQHPDRVGGVPGLTQEPAPEHHFGVSPEDQRRPISPERLRDGSRLGQGDRGDGLGRRNGWMLLGNSAGQDGEGDAELGQEFSASGRGRSQDQRGGTAQLRTQPMVQLMMRGFESVITRSLDRSARRRNFGRLKECRWACPSQYPSSSGSRRWAISRSMSPADSWRGSCPLEARMNPQGVPKQEMNPWYGATTGKTSRRVRWTAPKKKISLTLVMPACMVITPRSVSRSRTSV